MGVVCIQMEVNRSTLKIVTERPIGKRLLGSPTRRWDENIRMHLKDKGYLFEWFYLLGSEYGLLDNPCECGIQSQASISHRSVSK